MNYQFKGLYISLKRNGKLEVVEATGLQLGSLIYKPNQNEDFKISRGKL